MNRAIFLDRDGTLNIDRGYTHKAADLELFPGVIEGLKLLKERFLFFIVTNQSGIGRGMYTYDDARQFNEALTLVLKNEGIHIEKIYICPHTPEENCECRKPNTKFIEKARSDFDLDIKNSFVIGDKQCDVEMGKKSGAKNILVLTGMGQEEKNKSKPYLDYTAGDMVDAAQWILKQMA